MRAIIFAACLIGSVAPEPEPEPPSWEPLDLPADPGAPGTPIGVRAVTFEDQTFEVWYPAPDSVAGSAAPLIDLGRLPSVAVRDVPARPLEGPVPALLFSEVTR